MKTTLLALMKSGKITVWGEAYDKHNRLYIETDKRGAEYATSTFSNLKAVKTACGYAPEINKWWVALA